MKTRNAKYRKNINDSQKGEIDQTIGLLDTDKIDVVKFVEEDESKVEDELEDTAHGNDFTVNVEDSKKTYGAEQQADPDPVIPDEMKPFCKEHEFDEATLSKEAKATPKHAVLDRPADKKGSE